MYVCPGAFPRVLCCGLPGRRSVPRSGGFAFAASFAPTNVTVAVDRNTVTQGYGETITSTLSFCVPDAQSAGDSFTVTLPEVLSNWPAGFPFWTARGRPSSRCRSPAPAPPSRPSPSRPTGGSRQPLRDRQVWSRLRQFRRGYVSARLRRWDDNDHPADTHPHGGAPAHRVCTN